MENLSKPLVKRNKKERTKKELRTTKGKSENQEIKLFLWIYIKMLCSQSVFSMVLLQH